LAQGVCVFLFIFRFFPSVQFIVLFISTRIFSLYERGSVACVCGGARNTMLMSEVVFTFAKRDSCSFP